MRYNRIFLCLLAALLLFAGCNRAEAAKAPQSSEFLDEIYFLGDSITAHMQQRAAVSASRILASKQRYLNLDSRITYARIVAPDTGDEEPIATVVGRLQPRYLVITLGIDYGVYYYRNEPQKFTACYQKLLDSLQAASPNTVLLPQSIFPVTAASAVITNEMIDNANTLIAALSAERGLYYLDTQSVLRDENGFLRAEYCFSEDGIHLNEAAYAAILSYISSQAEQVGWRA